MRNGWMGKRTRAGLRHARDEHDRQPASRGGRLERSKAIRRHVGELEALRRREVARETDARVDQNDVQETQHGRTTVLDLHDLIPAHVTFANEAERVPHTKRGGDADVALGEHGGGDRRGRRLEGRRLEGVRGLKKGEGDGCGAHDSGVACVLCARNGEIGGIK
jgi:hypothetical protein